MGDKVFLYIRIFFIIIGSIFILDSVGLLFTGWNSSKVFSGLFGVLFIVISIIWSALAKSDVKWLYNSFLVSLSLFILSLIIVESLLLITAHKKSNEKDALIILGAGLRGTAITLTLADRLDTAVEYLNEYPKAISVVSGGQGPDELITEAAAMKGYLVKKGITENRVLIEDKSTSTFENFILSKKVLDDYYNGRNYSTAYVTNTFHVYRAGLIAKKSGIPSDGLSAPTVWYTRLNYYLREYLATIKFYILGH